ncbi:MAG: hypothetical protein ABFR62_12205 [Bacteroidota bacterium]
MKNRILLFTFLFATIVAKSQKSDNYVILNNDKLIEGEEMVYYKPFFSKPRITINDNTYKAPEIKFFSMNGNLHANVTKYSFWGKSRFAFSLENGEVNLFEFRKTYTDMNTGGVSSRSWYYYNRGFGEIHKVRYSSLRKELSDNAKSLVYLDKFRKNTIIGKSLFYGGVTIFFGEAIYGLGKALTDDLSEKGMKDNFIIAAGGIGLALAGTIIVEIGGVRNLKKAVREYNNGTPEIQESEQTPEPFVRMDN